MWALPPVLGRRSSSGRAKGAVTWLRERETDDEGQAAAHEVKVNEFTLPDTTVRSSPPFLIAPGVG